MVSKDELLQYLTPRMDKIVELNDSQAQEEGSEAKNEDKNRNPINLLDEEGQTKLDISIQEKNTKAKTTRI